MNRTFCYAAILATIFSVAPAQGDVTPMDAVLKEDGVTRITCAYGGEPATPAPGVTFNPPKGEYHYDLYLPAGYDADLKAVFPCLFVASPGGNARLGVMAERVKRDRFIAVMLVESKNGPWEPGIANFCAAHDDVVKRLRVHGDKDMAVPYSQGELLLAALKKAGVEASLFTIKGGSHASVHGYNEMVMKEFFDKKLKNSGKTEK